MQQASKSWDDAAGERHIFARTRYEATARPQRLAARYERADGPGAKFLRASGVTRLVICMTHEAEPTLMSVRPAAQYLRMSRDHQRYSMENQAMAISTYAEANSYEVVKTYVDAGRSGVTTKRRSGLSQLLADVVGGKADFKTILVLDVSRWGRYQDADEAAHYEFMCKAAGVEIVYSGEGFTEGLGGAVYKHIKRVMAGEYSRELSLKIRASKGRSARAGHAPGGRCPYGFARQIVNPDGTLGRVLERGERKPRPEQILRMVPEGPVQSKALRQIFRLFVNQRLPPVRITEQLNAQGSVYIDGAPWDGCAVSRVLRCELVTGRQPYGKTTSVLGQPLRRNPRETWSSVEIFPPIVSARFFEAAQARLQALGGNRVKTDEEMLEDLSAIYVKHGRISARLIDATRDAPTSWTYYSRFGSLSRARKLIGVTCASPKRGLAPDGRRLSRAEVLNAIRRLHAAKGRIDAHICHADKALPPLGWLRAEFGGIAAAFDAAGIEHDTAHGRRKHRPRPNVDFATGAPDPGNGIHTGPLGGRYFIAAKGRKQYGV